VPGLEPGRDDDDRGSRFVVNEILLKIESARMVICDLSGYNANAILETGWALRADKPFVLIKDNLAKYTFDLNQQYTVTYDHRLRVDILDEDRDRLRRAIVATMEDQERRYSIVASLGIAPRASLLEPIVAEVLRQNTLARGQPLDAADPLQTGRGVLSSLADNVCFHIREISGLWEVAMREGGPSASARLDAPIASTNKYVEMIMVFLQLFPENRRRVACWEDCERLIRSVDAFASALRLRRGTGHGLQPGEFGDAIGRFGHEAHCLL